MLSEFWQAIVGSAVISTIISNLCLWWHKKNDYKRDYYKKIIDKRIEAYEELEEFVFNIDKMIYCIVAEPPFLIYSCFEDEYKSWTEKRSISDIIKRSEWYSADVINCLRKIEEILKKGLESLRDIEEATEEEEYLQRMHAIECFGGKQEKSMKEIIENLRIAIKDDWNKLDDVESFLKR